MSKSPSGLSLANFAEPFQRRVICKCASLYKSQIQFTRILSTSSKTQDQTELYGNRGRQLRTERRWETTPPRMMAPVRSKPPVDDNDYIVNKDPAKLDSVYNKILGQDGDKWLTDEVKWLAVTHKSFDHGRRGFNDRLAFLGMYMSSGVSPGGRAFCWWSSIGRRIVELQTSLALVHRASADGYAPTPDQYGREPFSHQALQGLEGLTENAKFMVMEKRRLSRLGERYGIDGVLRWKPRRVWARSLDEIVASPS